MYQEIGKKIMSLAKLMGWLAIVGGVLVALVCMAGGAGMGFLGILIGFFVGLAGYIGSWALYGFGQLVDDTCENRRLLQKLAERRTIGGVSEPQSVRAASGIEDSDLPEL